MPRPPLTGVPRRAALAALFLAACAPDERAGVHDPAAALLAPGDAPARSVAAGPPQRWSDPATWGGRLPAAGANVTIPAGRTVVLDVSPPALGALTIDGALRFGDADLELAATSILVNGTLSIGTAERPHLRRATIALVGDPTEEAAPGLGVKALAVRGTGTLDLHGAPRVSWGKLDATAPAGATTLTLDRPVDWQPGDRIIVTATGFDARETEEATVRTVSGASVTLAAPLRHAHWGQRSTVGGRTLDERAEVGLLSRTVRVTTRFGADSLLGGHAIFTDRATVRVSGVEFSHLGQPGRLGRYPFHWHLMGSAPGSYLRRSSVPRSLQRGIIVHGTSDTQIEDNVIHDVRGHGVYVEDGSERNVLIARNLASLAQEVRREHILQGPTREDRHGGTDQRASNFWFATANLRVVDNVAAGSVHGFGFWYDLATGNGHHPRDHANSYVMGEFRGNSAHSQGAHPHTMQDYHPMESGSGLRFDGGDFRGVFREFKAWKNMNAGAWFNCGQTVEASVLAGNRIGALTYCFQGEGGTFAGTLRHTVVASATPNTAGVASLRAFFRSRDHRPQSQFHGVVQDRRIVPHTYPVVRTTRLDRVTRVGF